MKWKPGYSALCWKKEITTPDYYPLSLNALVNACNQKSNRDPVMNLDEDSVRGALRACMIIL